MPIDRVRVRKLHRALVPFMAFPLLITLMTGLLFQFAVVSNHASDFLWLLELHRGKFGQINLESIYPFINALGLLTLLITGCLMWFQAALRRPKSN